MRFDWVFTETESMQVKTFLKTKGVSRGLLAKVKFQGGDILVNQERQNAIYFLEKGDRVSIIVPDEGSYETTLASFEPIEIVYEDEHLLVVNKPFGVASLPSKEHPDGTMSNRVKGYYIEQKYVDQIIHIVTRLDRDTTGLMLFAKHGYAHSLMDQLLREKALIKKYKAIVSGRMPVSHDLIDAPIGRVADSIICREVRPDGKKALTEYWVEEVFEAASMVDIQLHTGRTHQIRVHFSNLGHPLLGDDLYGGLASGTIQRQALHCASLSFVHPFTGKEMNIQAELPDDMQEWLLQNRK